jgi:hypothetical protein
VETESVSRDLAAAVKTYCYNNLHEFYQRHIAQYDISYQTFVRCMAGERVSEETRLRVLMSLRSLNLAEGEHDIPTHFDTLYTMLYSFAKAAEEAVASPGLDQMKKLQELAKDARQFLKPYIGS